MGTPPEMRMEEKLDKIFGFIGGPRRIRTYDLLIKSQLLYRTELAAHI